MSSFMVVAVTTTFVYIAQAAEYNDVNILYDDLFEHGNASGGVYHGYRYDTRVRPLINQSKEMQIYTTINLMNLIELNDRLQFAAIDAFLYIYWKDELLAWNPSHYGGIRNIHPYPHNLWRPRLLLVNTHDERDVFKDDFSHIEVSNDGIVSWFPGNVLKASCATDVRNFPFDDQECQFEFECLNAVELELNCLHEHSHTDGFENSGEFYMHHIKCKSGYRTNKTELNKGLDHLPIRIPSSIDLPRFKVTVHVARRPWYFLANVIIPTTLLSGLTMVTFLIPVNSGEKISFIMSVTLALSLFLSITADLLPQGSESMPKVTLYVLMMLFQAISICIACAVEMWANAWVKLIKEERKSKLPKRKERVYFVKRMFGNFRSFVGSKMKKDNNPNSQGNESLSIVSNKTPKQIRRGTVFVAKADFSEDSSFSNSPSPEKNDDVKKIDISNSAKPGVKASQVDGDLSIQSDSIKHEMSFNPSRRHDTRTTSNAQSKCGSKKESEVKFITGDDQTCSIQKPSSARVNRSIVSGGFGSDLENIINYQDMETRVNTYCGLLFLLYWIVANLWFFISATYNRWSLEGHH